MGARTLTHSQAGSRNKLIATKATRIPFVQVIANGFIALIGIGLLILLPVGNRTLLQPPSTRQLQAWEESLLMELTQQKWMERPGLRT